MNSVEQPVNVVVSQPAAVVQPPGYPPQQQVIVVGQHAPPVTTSSIDPRQKHKRTLFGLGIAECVIGSLSVLLAVIAIVIQQQRIRFSGPIFFTYTSQGIWCGIFVIVTGILGVRVKYTPSRGMYIANMIMAIVTANIVFSGLVLSGIAAATSFRSVELIAIHSIIALLCLSAMIITITHSAFCCGGVCSSDSVTTQQVIYPPQQVAYTQQQSLPQTYVHQPVVMQPVTPQKQAQQSAYRTPMGMDPPKYNL